jgi:hypothetical protein
MTQDVLMANARQIAGNAHFAQHGRNRQRVVNVSIGTPPTPCLPLPRA